MQYKCKFLAFRGVFCPSAFVGAMDANVDGEGPSNMNNDEENTHADDIDEL
jgi:hypothetical protein